MELKNAVTIYKEEELGAGNMNLQLPGQIPPPGYPMGQLPFQQIPISQAAIDRMAIMEMQFYQSQALIEQREAEKRKTNLQTMEARQKLRELNESRNVFQRLTVYENRTGQLCVEVDGGAKVVSDVTEACNFRLRHYLACEPEFPSVYVIEWEGRVRKSVFLSDASFVPEKLIQKLEKNGAVFSVASRYRKSFSVALYEYLLWRSEEIILPISHGWQNIQGKWKFVTEREMTMEDLYE